MNDLSEADMALLENIRKRKAELLDEIEQIKTQILEVDTQLELLDCPDPNRIDPKAKQLSIGVKKFNMEPARGIEYLINNQLLENTPESVATFLFKGEGLNKSAVGDYIGERKDFNVAVLTAFSAKHEFHQLSVVGAMRQYMMYFKIPGESQKILRIMEAFAKQYCEFNRDSEIKLEPEPCSCLAYAILFLNTALHNPSNKIKTTIHDFVSIVQALEGCDKLPKEYIEKIFDNIKKEPFKFPDSDDSADIMTTFFNPEKEGWLWKQGGRYKTWRHRWFILKDTCLYYFEYTTDHEPKGIIPLENLAVREVDDRSKQFAFELFSPSNDMIKACKTNSDGKMIEGKHSVYRMSATTAEEKEDWISRLRSNINRNPFQDVISRKKSSVIVK